MLVVTDIVRIVQYVQHCTIYNYTVQDATLYNTQYNLILYNMYLQRAITNNIVIY